MQKSKTKKANKKQIEKAKKNANGQVHVSHFIPFLFFIVFPVFPSIFLLCFLDFADLLFGFSFFFRASFQVLRKVRISYGLADIVLI